MKLFYLDREKDISGVSGVGRVGEGVCFDDGVTVLHWFGKIRSTTMFSRLEDLLEIHSHGGTTHITWAIAETEEIK